MFDLEDGFIIESYTASWLIWVHLLVIILLVIVLLCGFSIFDLDLSNNPACNSASTSSSSLTSNQSRDKDPLLNGSSPSRSSKVEGNKSIQRVIETSIGKGVAGEETVEREQSSAKDLALFRPFGRTDHPCSYLGLAKQAILKCLGLGYSSESCHKSEHGKED